MGEVQDTLFEPEFNRSVKVQTSTQRITSHAGAVLLREWDHQLGLIESLAGQLTDPRSPEKIRYTATELLRERIYAFALGNENQGAMKTRMTSTGSRTTRRCGWPPGTGRAKKCSDNDSPVSPRSHG